MALQTGVNVIGKLLGHMPTDRNPDYHRIGIQISVPDGFGGSNDETIFINSNNNNINRLSAHLNNAKGRQVIINVLTRAVSGRNGAFVSYDAYAGTEINALPATEKSQATTN